MRSKDTEENSIVKRKRISLISCIIFFLFSCLVNANAQVPGSWVKYEVCAHCTPPLTAAFANTLEGFVMGSRSWRGRTNTYRTSDGGKTWVHFSDTVQIIHYDSTTAGELIIFDSKFTDAPILYDPSGYIGIITDDGVCKSHDTGRYFSVWRPLPGRIKTGMIQDPSTSIILTGYVYNEFNTRLQLRITHDSGKNFEPYCQEFSVRGNVQTACIQDSVNAWFAASNHGDTTNRLYHTMDGGQSWKAVFPADTTLIGRFSYEIIKGAATNTIFLVSDIGYLQILGQNYNFLFTTDNGVSWSGTWTLHGDIYWNSNHVLQNPRSSELWCVLSNQHTIAYSTNNGTNWAYDSVTFKNDSIANMIWQDSAHAFILGYKDSTIHLYTYVPLADSVNASIGSTNKISIYPNPIAGLSTISYSLSHYQYIKLELIDQLGRAVRLLTAGNEESGVKTVSFSTNDLAKGMYFLRFESDEGELVEKIVVVR